jgi:folate-binding protein YgfZ
MTGYEALTTSAAAVAIDRDVIRASGPDAVSFLQGQLSQDIAALAIGASGWSFVLQPQGKVDAWVRVTRTGEDEVVIDVDGGFGEAVVARLQRFKLRVKADFEMLPWRCIAVRGPDAPAAGDARGELVVAFTWGWWRGFDVFGTSPEAPGGLAHAEPADYEVCRIEAGIPVMGAELTERTIPAEAGVVEVSVSFSKGCYTGQELVARIDSRGGRVPRRLRGVVSDAVLQAGVDLEVDGRVVGSVTSAARHPSGHTVGLAYVGRDVEPPADVSSGGAVVSVRALPAVS